MSYDILLKNGTVIDPAAGIHGRLDIGVTDGAIVAVESDLSRSEAGRVIEAGSRFRNHVAGEPVTLTRGA